MDSVRVKVDQSQIRTLSDGVLMKLGVSAEDAEIVTDIHLDSEMRGEESHGIRLLFPHFERIKAGTLRTASDYDVISDRKATALLDARHGLGQPIGVKAMRLAIEKARTYGVGIVGVKNANSFTSAKYYPMIAADQGMIGLAYTNSRPMMPPVGGAKARIGNNPFSIASPTGDEPPLVLDMAFAIAREKVWQAKAEGRDIPEGWALGPDGKSTRNPSEALEGALLPFGGHKAFGIALMNEVLTSVLCGGELATGAGTGFRPYDNPYRATQLFQAIDVSYFGDVGAFTARADELIRYTRTTPPQEGAESILVPGERGHGQKLQSMSDGLLVRKDVLAELLAYCDTYGVDVPLQLRGEL